MGGSLYCLDNLLVRYSYALGHFTTKTSTVYACTNLVFKLICLLVLPKKKQKNTTMVYNTVANYVCDNLLH